MRKQRTVMTVEKRNERHKQAAEMKIAGAAAAEAALDEKIRRNIELYGA